MSGPIYRPERHLRSVRRWFAVVRDARRAGLSVDRWEWQGRRRLRDIYRDEINDMATRLRNAVRKYIGECETCLSVLGPDGCARCAYAWAMADAEEADEPPKPRDLFADDYDPWAAKHAEAEPGAQRDIMGALLR